jgi:hypothetical protein
MRFLALVVALMLCGNAYANDCSSGNCNLRSRVVNTTKEVISVPVVVTRKTIETTRNVGRRLTSRVRSVVR